MAMRRRWSNTWGVAQCSMSRATPEATGRCHRATTRSSGYYSLRITPATDRASINKTTMQNIPTLLVVLMAIERGQYHTQRIAQWRGSRAFIKATKCRHQASTHSNSTNWTCQRLLILTFHRENGLELTCWPRITIWAWNIKLMRSILLRDFTNNILDSLTLMVHICASFFN